MTPSTTLPSAQRRANIQPLTPEDLRKIDAYWRAANYLSVGQIYLYANPLLREPLKIEHIKPRLLGHFGTTPGLNFIYAHFNRLIKKYDLNVDLFCRPWPWRARNGCEHVPGGHLQRVISQHPSKRRGNEEAV